MLDVPQTMHAGGVTLHLNAQGTNRLELWQDGACVLVVDPQNDRDSVALAYLMRRAANHFDEIAKRFQARKAKVVFRG